MSYIDDHHEDEMHEAYLKRKLNRRKRISHLAAVREVRKPGDPRITVVINGTHYPVMTFICNDKIVCFQFDEPKTSIPNGSIPVTAETKFYKSTK